MMMADIVPPHSDTACGFGRQLNPPRMPSSSSSSSSSNRRLKEPSRASSITSASKSKSHSSNSNSNSNSNNNSSTSASKPRYHDAATTRKPYPYFYYRDYSTLVDADPQAPLTCPGRAPNFPTLMHSILNRPDLTDIVAWMPHGRSWRVLKPREFEARVIPQYFTHSKFSSFVRQANGWGFRRITTGVDRNTYYHPLFLRGLPHLIKLMKRPGVAEKQTLDQDYEPDLHKISELHPLPDVPANNHDSKNMLASSTGASNLSLPPAPPATVSSASLATLPVEEITVDESEANNEDDGHEDGSASDDDDDASSSSTSLGGPPPVVPLSIPQLPAEFHRNPEAVSKEYTAGFAMGLAYSRQKFEMLLKVMGSSMQPFVQEEGPSAPEGDEEEDREDDMDEDEQASPSEMKHEATMPCAEQES